MARQSIVAIVGPTASGKSSLAMALAERFAGEIVNADSVQIYQEFDIGSAKPSPDELARIRHHLISVLAPNEQCDAGRFIELADTAIAGSAALSLVVGGSGLYLQALLNGLVAVDRGTDEARARVEQAFCERGAEGVHQWLSELDPRSAARLHPNDISRSRRALEVALSHGSSLREANEEHQGGKARYRALVICLLPPRTELYRRINHRVELMFESGLLDEVRRIVAKYGIQVPGCQAIGYRQCCAHLAGELSYDEMVEQIKRDTRRFAKRQFTWWRHQPTRLGWEVVGLESAPLVKGENLRKEPGKVTFEGLVRIIEDFLHSGPEKSGDQVTLVPVGEIHFGLTAE